MRPLTLKDRWNGISNNLRIRVSRLIDRPESAKQIEALLRQKGHPIAYEVFDREFVLCEPHLAGIQGDPDIAVVIGDAEYELFFVAQRERGGLSSISVHESIHDALRDFLGRAIGCGDHASTAGLIVRRDPS